MYNDLCITITLLQHEDYDPVSPYPNDLALVNLPTPADLSPSDVGTICLPPQDTRNNYTNNDCWISGWGLTDGTVYPLT